jgi:Ca2+-binding RTX toxin-like protein
MAIKKITGTAGNDSLVGSAGFDNDIDGLGGNDTLIGQAGNDTLRGGLGADSMVGGNGNDTYYVDDVGDKVVEATGTSSGIDTVYTSLAAYTLGANVENGLAWNRTLGAALTGNTLNNALTGSVGNDTLDGGAGNDTLDGGAGNDYLQGGTGSDSMKGGTGNDVYYVDSSGDVVTELTNEGKDTVYTSLATYTLGANLEVLTLWRRTLNTKLVGNALGNVVTGGVGDDTIDGGVGADTMSGGMGYDVYYVDNVADVVNEAVDGGRDQVNTSLAYYKAGANIEVVSVWNRNIGSELVANDLGNSLGGGGGSDTLTGGASNDVLDGGLGADTMKGGLGNDTYYMDNLGDVVIEAADQGIDSIYTTLTTYTLGANFENLYSLNADSNDYFIGNELDNRIATGGGFNTVFGGAGNDYITTRVDYSQQLKSTTNTFYGENGNDYLESYDGNHYLSGGAGNDTIASFSDSATATLVGGTGDDVYRITHSPVNIIENANEGVDTIVASRTHNMTAQLRWSISIENLPNIENLGYYADEYDSAAFIYGTTLIGNALDNRLYGSIYNDSLYGGDGNDWLLDSYDYTGSGVRESGGSNLMHGGNGNDKLQGGLGLDTLYGDAGNDFLSGSSGPDWMDGGTGDDYMLDDEPFFYPPPFPPTSKDLGDTYVFAQGYGKDVVSDLGGNVGIGFTSTDTLLLMGANIQPSDVVFNRIGANGNDLVVSYVGEDRNVNSLTWLNFFLGGDANTSLYRCEKISFESGTVWDLSTVAGMNQFISTQVRIIDTSPKKITGNTGNDSLVGEAVFDNDMDGLSGNDTLVGQRGNDILQGGLGADSMVGNDGNDSYYVDDIGDKVVEAESINSGIDTVYTNLATYTLTASVENAILWNRTLGAQLLGNAAANKLNGGIGNDTIDGGVGADIMQGDSGDDTYYVDSTADVVKEFADGGLDTINSNAAVYQLSDYIEIANVWNNNLGGKLIANNTGSQLNGSVGMDTLIGGATRDWLDGSTGADYLSGGLGNDIYFVDNVNDVVIEDALTGGVDKLATTLTSYTLADNVESLYYGYRGGVNISVQTNLNLQFNGNSGNNGIYTSDGNDTVHGYGGNDYILEGGYATGLGDDVIYGDDGWDLIYAARGNDTVYGGQGYDTIIAGDGDDWIDGGTEDDIYRSVTILTTDYWAYDYQDRGNGSDTYVFAQGYGYDLVVDMGAAGVAETDTLRLLGASIQPSNVVFNRIGAAGNDLVVSYVGEDRNVNSLTWSNFFLGGNANTSLYRCEKISFESGTVWDLSSVAGMNQFISTQVHVI